MLVSQNLKFTRILKYTWKMDIVLLLTCTIVFVVHQYLTPCAVQIPPAIVTLLGTALAFFVGFNNNQSYGRWWEARIIWGALANDSRTWARSVTSYIMPGNSNNETVDAIKQKLIRRQIAFMYSLKDVLRKQPGRYFENYLGPEDLVKVQVDSNLPNAILTLNAKDLMDLLKGNSIDEFRFVQMDNLLRGFTDHMGKSERISNTVFPASYIYFTQLFIWILVAFVTWYLADTMGSWSILIGWIIGSVFHVTHKNGMGLVNPFDEIPTGIPLNQISRTIEINLLQMISEKDIPHPVKAINNEYML